VSQLKVHEPSMAPSSGKNTLPQRFGPAHKNQQGMPGDGGPGVAANGSNNTHTPGSANSTNKNAKSQQGGDREEIAVSHNRSTRPGKSIGPGGAEVVSQPETNKLRTEPSGGDNTNAQRSSGPTNRNAEGKLDDNHGVVQHHPSGRAQPGVRALAEAENKSSSDNQTWSDPASGVQDALNSRAGYGIGEGNQSTNNTGPANTNIQQSNLEGNFGGNNGSNNNYGDKYTVKEKMVFKDKVEININAERREEPKNIGRLSTHTHYLY